jgi:hypothetical protein
MYDISFPLFSRSKTEILSSKLALTTVRLRREQDIGSQLTDGGVVARYSNKIIKYTM